MFTSSTLKSKPLDLEDLLQFADLLAESVNVENSEQHHSIAQEIVTLLCTIEPNNPVIRNAAGSVLSRVHNYLGLNRAVPDYREFSFLERAALEYEKDYLRIPSESDKFFLDSQKTVFDHISADSFFSYSGPTSRGKSSVMRTFIR